LVPTPDSGDDFVWICSPGEGFGIMVGLRQWLNRHPRFAFHFTPTSCSWLNAVEGFFAKLASSAVSSDVWSISKPPSTAAAISGL
jgi:hypothetical protein